MTIREQRFLADDKGDFVSVIALREGNNRIRIRTVDVKGERTESVETVTLDTRGPDVSGQVEWGTSP